MLERLLDSDVLYMHVYFQNIAFVLCVHRNSKGWVDLSARVSEGTLSGKIVSPGEFVSKQVFFIITKITYKFFQCMKHYRNITLA